MLCSRAPLAPEGLWRMDLACVSLAVPRRKLSWRGTLMPGHRHLWFLLSRAVTLSSAPLFLTASSRSPLHAKPALSRSTSESPLRQPEPSTESRRVEQEEVYLPTSWALLAKRSSDSRSYPLCALLHRCPSASDEQKHLSKYMTNLEGRG